MLNKCMIIGNLGADPEMRYTANGTPVTSFRVATSRQYSGSDGQRHEETEWFSVVTWARLAETCSQYLSKGRQVFVEGRMQTRSWEGQDGQKRYRTELIADTVKFLGGREGRDGGGADAAQETFGGYAQGVPVGTDADGDVDPDDLPF
jgi:single-strand DNA-binding protein